MHHAVQKQQDLLQFSGSKSRSLELRPNDLTARVMSSAALASMLASMRWRSSGRSPQTEEPSHARRGASDGRLRAVLGALATRASSMPSVGTLGAAGSRAGPASAGITASGDTSSAGAPLELLAPHYSALLDGGSAAAAGAALLDAARGELQSRALCRLPGFFSAAGSAALAAEVAEQLLPRLRPPGSGGGVTDVRFLPGRAFPRSSALRRLFESAEMEALVSDLMGERVYRCVDLDRSLNISVISSGGSFGAHMDENACVVSLPLLTPALGGQFQWAPFCRTDHDDSIDGEAADGGAEELELVKSIFGSGGDALASVFGSGGGSGDVSRVLTHRVVAGEMLLFNGRRSLHRVCTVGADWPEGTEPGFATPTRVAPDQLRVAALFSYSRQPDYWWSHVDKSFEDPDHGYSADVLPQYLENSTATG